MADRSKRDTANAEFKKAQRAEDGKRAMSEYEAAAAAERVKTQRLREARLAREATLAEAPPKAGTTAKSAKKSSAKKAKGASGKLADWLDDQQKGGHKT
jgi:hypothetical protein